MGVEDNPIPTPFLMEESLSLSPYWGKSSEREQNFHSIAKSNFVSKLKKKKKKRALFLSLVSCENLKSQKKNLYPNSFSFPFFFLLPF